MYIDAEKCWKSCLEIIKSNVDESQYQTWFSPLAFVSYVEDTRTLTLYAPSYFILEYVEEHFKVLFKKVLVRQFGKGIQLEYRYPLNKEKEVIAQIPAPKTAENDINSDFNSHLDKSKTFETFIAGKSNQLTRAVALSIAENKSKVQFNPFFIFGPSGCGKTHLINAIGVKVKEVQPESHVLYISARQFMVDFMNATRLNKFNDFINFFQDIDVLIIDDIQEWSTEKTQEQFFHIFNHLFRNGKRIILASDRPPVDLNGMNERMLTRLKCGLVAEIERPDPQLCKDILLDLLKRNGLKVASNVIDYIAENTNRCVRDIEGVVNSLVANSIVFNCEIDIELAQKTVGNIVRKSKHEISLDEIMEHVCSNYHVNQEEISGKSRKQELVLARQMVMYLAAKHTKLSKSQIGRRVAQRDHATVLHSCAKIDERLKTDAKFGEEIRKIERLFT